MPASSADTFWGKGFLATALGTASPDRKKTHKGQTRLTSSTRCDHLGIYRKKQRRSAHLMHTRTFLKQGGRRQDTVRRAFPQQSGYRYKSAAQFLFNSFVASFHKKFPSVQKAWTLLSVKRDSSHKFTQSLRGPNHKKSVCVFFEMCQKRTQIH